ncbi:MAG: histidinol-phosphate transaminase [Spirochaetaceae bacterium]
MIFKENIKAIPPYVPGIKIEGKEKLASNENPLGSSPMAIKAIQQIDNYSVYPDGSCKALREAIAKKHHLLPENVIVGNGSDEILMWPSLCLIGKNDNAVTALNTFSEYTFSTLVTDGEIRKAPLVNGTFDKKAMLELVDKNTKILYICNPNNPTGTYLPKKQILDFIQSVPKDILVVVDEAYGEYGAEDYYSCIREINNYPNLLILKTFSKIYGLASLRLGYAFGNQDLIENLWRSKQPFNVNQAAQTGGLAALSDTDFVEQSLAMNKQGREYLYKELDNMGMFYYKTGANFICIDVKKDSKEIYNSILEQGMTIRSCTSFGLPNHIRVTIGSKEQNQRFISYLKNAIK